MATKRPFPFSWRHLGLSALFWGGIGGYQYLLGLMAAQRPIESAALIRDLVVFFFPLAGITPAFLAICGNLVADATTRARLWRRLGEWIALWALLHTSVHFVAHLVLASMPPGFSSLSVLMMSTVYYAMIGFLGVAMAQKQQAEVRQRELLDAQLRALRAQLQPHFLFNTLHAIGVTTRTDPTVAVRMLALLGDLLRQTLRERDGQLVSLAEERDLLQPYLELQQLRFADRLRFEVDFPAEVLGAAVPDLLLQPLVENALQHGIEQRPQGGTVRIAARRRGERLEIQVRDDGVGLATQPANGSSGIGLGTTRARLQALFGAAAEVKLAADPAGGTIAMLILPFHELAPAAETHVA